MQQVTKLTTPSHTGACSMRRVVATTTPCVEEVEDVEEEEEEEEE